MINTTDTGKEMASGYTTINAHPTLNVITLTSNDSSN
jgi:hypothetical protein